MSRETMPRSGRRLHAVKAPSSKKAPASKKAAPVAPRPAETPAPSSRVSPVEDSARVRAHELTIGKVDAVADTLRVITDALLSKEPSIAAASMVLSRTTDALYDLVEELHDAVDEVADARVPRGSMNLSAAVEAFRVSDGQVPEEVRALLARRFDPSHGDPSPESWGGALRALTQRWNALEAVALAELSSIEGTVRRVA